MADNEGIYGLAKKLIPPQARFYTQTLLGDRTKPFTQEDLTPAELRQVHDAITASRERLQNRISTVKAAKSFEDLPKSGYFGEEIEKKLSSEKDQAKVFKEIKALNAKHEANMNKGFGNVQYLDYPKDSQMTNTLGRFTYKIQPDGSIHVSDKYDFYNPFRAENVKMFEQMTPTEKALKVAEMTAMGTDSGKNSEATTYIPNHLTAMAGTVGEAYIGRDGRPVDIKYHPEIFKPKEIPQEAIPSSPMGDAYKKGGMIVKPLKGGHKTI
jgi:hypothetical protein